MESNNLVSLFKELKEKNISQEEALEKLKYFSISEEDIKVVLSLAKDGKEKDGLPLSLLLAKASDITGKMAGESHFLLAETFRINNDIEHAIEHYDRAVDIFKHNNQLVDGARCDLGRADIYIELEKFEEAIEFYDKAGYVFAENNLPVDVARCDAGKGEAYSYLRRFEDSIKFYDSAIEIFKENNRWSELALCTLFKATVYRNLRKFDKAIELYNEARHIFKEHNQWIDVAKCDLNKAITWCNIRNFDEAIKLYDEAAFIFKENKLFIDVAKCDLNRANIYLLLGSFEEAIKLYDEAKDIFKEYNQGISAGRCDFNKANVYLSLQKFNEALALYDEAKDVFKENNQCLDVARCDLGRAKSYVNLQRFEEALSLFEEAGDIFRENNQWIDTARCDSNKANIYMNLQRFDEAIILFDGAKDIFKENKLWIDTARCDLNRAIIYLDLQKFEDAIELLDEAKEIFKINNCCIDIARCNSNKGTAYRNLQKFDEALTLFHEARDIFKKYRQKLDVAVCDLNRANIYLELRKFDKALALYDRAEEVFRKNGRYVDTARCDLNKAIVYDNLQKFEDSIKLYDRAEKILKKHKQRVSVARCVLNKAALYHKLKNFDKAINLYKKAKKICSNVPEIKWMSLYGLGEIYKIHRDFTKSVRYFKEAVKVIEEKTLSSMTHPDFKTILREKTLIVYESLVNSLLETGRLKEALEYVEKTKARNLAEIMAGSEISPRAPHEVREEDRKFKLKLSSLQFIMSREEDMNKREKAFSEFKETKENFLKFVEEIREKFDGFYEPFYEVKGIKYKKIKKLVKDEETALIEFFLSSDKSCAFIVKKKEDLDAVFFDFSLREFYKEVNDYLESYNHYRRVPGTVTFKHWLDKMERILSLLYEKIFLKLEDKLSHIKKIIFIPHKILFFIPLHGMYKKVTGKKKYILEDYEVTYSPGSQILEMCYKRKRNKKEKLFSFQCDTTGNLKYSSREAEKIKKFFSKENIIYGETYEDILRFAGNSNFPHFLCHGDFLFDKPLESGLYVFNNKGEEVKFTLRDIFTRMSLPEAYMVTLSACETGMIKYGNTDEFTGLPSGFIFAGSPSVIASLWTVSDNSTGELMIRFYENIMKKGMSKASSLRKAQLDIKKLKKSEKSSERMTFINSERKSLSWEHPYYWAGFCCYGAD